VEGISDEERDIDGRRFVADVYGEVLRWFENASLE
jgi:hypothetical protein